MKKDFKNFIYSKQGISYSKTDREDWLPLYEIYLDGLSIPQTGELYGLDKRTLKEYFIKFGFNLLSREEVVRRSSKKRSESCLLKYGATSATKADIVKSKIRNTNLERYGVPCTLQNEEVSAKSKITCLEKYGVPHASSSEIIREKVRDTNKERLGVFYPAQSLEVLEKMRETNLVKYGVSASLLSEKAIQKTKKTNLERYGFENAMQSHEVRNKIKKTNLERYGFENAMQSHEVRNKVRQTNLERYGVSCKCNLNYIKERNLNKLRYSKGLEWGILLSTRGYALLDEYTKIQRRDETGYYLGWVYYAVRHNYCGHTFKHKLHGEVNCPKCFPTKFGTSQKVISDFIESLRFEININDRKMIAPKEIDILIPELNIGFEYNGTYHHGSKFQDDKHYHKTKSDLCLEKGIKLYHIWEHDNLDIIKSMIKSCLGKSEVRYYARKLKVKEVSIKERREFFNNNHLHGDVNSSFSLGLYEDSKLISCISFRKHKEGIEIARFATLLNSSCVGGFSKLLKHGVDKCKVLCHTKIITYCDRDWTPNYKDSVYFKNGFSFVKDTGVQLKYYDKYKIVRSRETYQKHKLREMFPETYSDSKTADQILEENNVYSIHNSGNWKFELSI